MAEFCFDCYNKLHGGNKKEENYILSDELDLCEGCGEYKRTVIRFKKYTDTVDFILEILLFPIYIIRIIIFCILRFFIR